MVIGATEPADAEPGIDVVLADLGTHAVRAAGWSFLQVWGSRVINLVVFTVLGHLLHPHAFGVVAAAAAILALFLMLQDQGLGQALVQRHQIDDDHLSTAFWTSVAVGAVLFAVTALVAQPVADGFGQPQLAGVLRWLGLSFVISGSDTIQMAIMRRRLRFRALAHRELLAAVVGGAVGIGVAVAGYPIQALVAQTLVGLSTGAILLWLASDWRPKRRFSRSHLRDLTPFSAYTAALAVMNFLHQRSDDLLIGLVQGSVALGYYSIGYRLLLFVTDLFINVINSLALPVFARIQDDAPRLRQALARVLTTVSAIAIPAFSVLGLYAKDVIRVAFGSNWSSSVPVLRVLSIVGLLQAFNFVLQWLLLSVGAKRESLQVNTISAVVNVAGFAVAVHWGIVAVAISFVARAYLVFPLTIRATRRVANVGWKEVFGPVVAPLRSYLPAAALLVLCDYLTASLPSSARLGIAAPVVLVIYVVGIRLLAPSLWVQLKRYGAILLGRKPASSIAAG